MPTAQKQVALTREQHEAVGTLGSFPKRVQTLGGYAGTGKTTLIKALKKRCPAFAVCAFTGKAAHVLRRKGLPSAKTIHSTIYDAREQIVRDFLGRPHRKIVFELKPPEKLIARGFIVDEASMVSRALYDDLNSYDRPIIFVGDHGQLEPVGDSFNLMTNPDITLETIHRNAGEIAHFANFIRQGNTPANWRRHKQHTGKGVRFRSLGKMSMTEVHSIDQCICAFNHTRVMANECFREELGLPADRPVAGDRVMCLRNDSQKGIFNGQQGIISELFANEMDFLADGELVRVQFDPDQFNNPKRPPFPGPKGCVPFDYCYAITCHKAQGDEWDKVMVLEQKCYSWEHARWCYTAASRARKRLNWICHDQLR